VLASSTHVVFTGHALLLSHAEAPIRVPEALWDVLGLEVCELETDVDGDVELVAVAEAVEVDEGDLLAVTDAVEVDDGVLLELVDAPWLED
jgi:hypothetical protein